VKRISSLIFSQILQPLPSQLIFSAQRGSPFEFDEQNAPLAIRQLEFNYAVRLDTSATIGCWPRIPELYIGRYRRLGGQKLFVYR